MALSKIKTGSITDSAVTTAKIADGTILDADVSSSTTISAAKLAVTVTYPTLSAISQSYIAPATATTFTITGTNFSTGVQVWAEKSDGSFTSSNSITRDSATTLTVNFTLAAEGDYYLRIENPDGHSVRSSTALLGVNNDPTWTTASGSLGSSAAEEAFSFNAVASETDSGAISYALVSGAFPGGGALTVNDNIATISGTETGSTTETTYTFSLEATDDESQKATREFSITITHGASGGCQFN